MPSEARKLLRRPRCGSAVIAPASTIRGAAGTTNAPRNGRGRCPRHDDAPVDAAGAVDAENASTSSLENHRTVFHSAHKAFFFTRQNGDISIELKPGTFLFRFDICYGRTLRPTPTFW